MSPNVSETTTAGNGVEPFRLHIGGTEVKPGWKILNIQPGPGVDFVGNCIDLSRFADASIDQIYASHVYEHLRYHDDLPSALKEACRVLKPGGCLLIGVPDFEMLCRLSLRPDLTAQDRWVTMIMMFGGEANPFDSHNVGLTLEFLIGYLGNAGFSRGKRVTEFGIFDDCTSRVWMGEHVSLNVIAYK